MKQTPNIFSFLIIFMCLICFWKSSANAAFLYPSKPQLSIDGSGKVICLSKAVDSKTLQTTIQGSWGNSFPSQMTSITDPEKFHVRDPILTSSSSAKATTKAAAVWMAKDLTTENHVIQGTLLTALGWKIPAFTLSLNDKSEQPRNDYQVTISQDGETIIVTWSSFIQSLNDTVPRCVMSKNGGLTWSPPVNMIIP